MCDYVLKEWNQRLTYPFHGKSNAHGRVLKRVAAQNRQPYVTMRVHILDIAWCTLRVSHAPLSVRCVSRAIRNVLLYYRGFNNMVTSWY
jgi:hypothetical protein